MDAVVPLLVIVPLLSLLGGIALAIVRAIGRQRQIELLQRERIAALERGVDPASLPTLATLGVEGATLVDTSLVLARNLLVGGVACLALGIGLVITFVIIEEHGEAWTLGIVPIVLGVGLLAASLVVRAQSRR